MENIVYGSALDILVRAQLKREETTIKSKITRLRNQAKASESLIEKIEFTRKASALQEIHNEMLRKHHERYDALAAELSAKGDQYELSARQ